MLVRVSSTRQRDPFGFVSRRCFDVFFEIDARIVVQAGGNGLGSMAKACIPLRVARRSNGERKKSVLCVIQRPSRASDNLRGAGTAGQPRRANNASAQPNRQNAGRIGRVHGLFCWLLRLVVCIVMANWFTAPAVDSPVHFEIDARIVVQAGGNGLGSMAKACIPLRVARRSYVPSVW